MPGNATTLDIPVYSAKRGTKLAGEGKQMYTMDLTGINGRSEKLGHRNQPQLVMLNGKAIGLGWFGFPPGFATFTDSPPKMGSLKCPQKPRSRFQY